jgi:transketolase
VRKACINMVHELARKHDRVVFIGSDLSPGLLGEMKEEMPDRHFMEGVMEANVIGMAAGMAMDGFVPYVNTIATFITRRCYEQVALDLCLHDLPVRLIGNGGGVVYAPLGPTHLAVEDIAILRALPNMTVTAVADAEEMVRLMEASVDWPHPLYIRLGKGGDPIVSRPENGFEIGKGITMRHARNPGHALMISCGVMTNRSLAAAELLETRGIDCAVLHIHTIKPLDERLIINSAREAGTVITIEEHTLIGGLGSAVIDLLVEQMGTSMPVVKKLGLKDKFSENYGTQDDLLKANGLQPPQIVAAVEELARTAEVV